MWCSLVSGTSCSPSFLPSHPQSPNLQRGDCYYHLMLWFSMNATLKTCLTKNAHIISAVPLCFLYDCCQRVREVLEQSVLLMDLHAQNTVQELADVVVVCSRVETSLGVILCTLTATINKKISIKTAPLSSVNMPDMSSTFMRPTPIKPLWISAEVKHHHYSQADRKHWIILNDSTQQKLYLWKNLLWSPRVEKLMENLIWQSISSLFPKHSCHTVKKKDKYCLVTGKPSKQEQILSFIYPPCCQS